ncbi:MAG: protein kinase [Deltaproteobacteria bacterium]|nr:protein kinase [Deltaproteobacteria bacterium]
MVTDFGIAKVLGAGTQTSTDMMLGTLLYCAPEQVLQSEGLDGRADLYSLGLVMYEMVAGGGTNLWSWCSAFTRDRITPCRRSSKRSPQPKYTSNTKIPVAMYGSR